MDSKQSGDRRSLVILLNSTISTFRQCALRKSRHVFRRNRGLLQRITLGIFLSWCFIGFFSNLSDLSGNTCTRGRFILFCRNLIYFLLLFGTWRNANVLRNHLYRNNATRRMNGFLRPLFVHRTTSITINSNINVFLMRLMIHGSTYNGLKRIDSASCLTILTSRILRSRYRFLYSKT